MIEVFREENSLQGDWIEAELRELVLGYECVVTKPGEVQNVLGSQHSLPAIRNGERIASGRDDLLAYLKELEVFAHDWRAFQGDWCYVNDSGEEC